MTEPQKMGVEEVMELVEEYCVASSDSNYLRVDEDTAKAKLKLALTTIIEERDRLSEQLVRQMLTNNAAVNDRDALALRVTELEKMLIMKDKTIESLNEEIHIYQGRRSDGPCF